MVKADGTIFTDRQVEVLTLRAAGHTQQEVAETFGTTGSNVSAIERAAMENIDKAQQTIELADTIAAEVSVTIAAETHFGDMIEMVYATADEHAIKIDYCRPELYSHLYDLVASATEGSKIRSAIEIGLTAEGDVNVYTGTE